MAERARPGKIDRKALRKADEFQTLTRAAASWADEHRSLLIAAAAGLAIIGLAAGVLSHRRANRREEAAVAFQAARQLFESSKFAEAAPAFADLAAAHSGTAFGSLAALYRGHALARSGDSAGAAQAYQEYLAAGPSSSYLRQAALVGLGSAEEAAGRSSEALDAFARAAEIDGPLKTEAILGQARALERTGQADKARDLYSALLAKNPEGDLLALLRSKVPAPTPASR